MWWISSAAAGGLVGWLIGWAMGLTRGRSLWLERRRRGFRKLEANERAIEEAKMLFEFGVIDEAELETRVGHLADWDGNP